VSSSDFEEIDLNLYKQLIGSLVYLVNNRPGVCYEVCTLRKFMSQWIQTHWIVAKHVLRCLRETIGHGLRHTSSIDMILQGYTDSDWEGSTVDKKIIFVSCFTLGSAMVSWSRRKHNSVGLTYTKA
jgi:hypothetical protein